MALGWMSVLLFLVAVLYSSVGFGGASSYLAVMSLFPVTPAFASTIALTLNVLVAGIAFLNYYRAKFFRWDLIWQFLLTSIPASFLGGMIKLSPSVYALLLNGFLLYVALRLFLMPNSLQSEETAFQTPNIIIALGVGAVLGLISGIIGIGGGIFLSPLIVLAKWGTAKQAAAVSAAFIVINSLSGLMGRRDWGQPGLRFLWGDSGGSGDHRWVSGQLLGLKATFQPRRADYLGIVVIAGGGEKYIDIEKKMPPTRFELVFRP